MGPRWNTRIRASAVSRYHNMLWSFHLDHCYCLSTLPLTGKLVPSFWRIPDRADSRHLNLDFIRSPPRGVPLRGWRSPRGLPLTYL